eukprot:6179224-Pleurochrysis_carterae.AAC.1
MGAVVNADARNARAMGGSARIANGVPLRECRPLASSSEQVPSLRATKQQKGPSACRPAAQ